jgi:hypothetical protein
MDTVMAMPNIQTLVISAEMPSLAVLPELSLQILELTRERGRMTMRIAVELTGANRSTAKKAHSKIGRRRTPGQAGCWPWRLVWAGIIPTAYMRLRPILHLALETKNTKNPKKPWARAGNLECGGLPPLSARSRIPRHQRGSNRIALKSR